MQVQRLARSVLPRLQWGALGNWASTEALGEEGQLWGHEDHQLHLKSDSEWKL